MFEVTDVFTILVWFLLCGIVAIVGLAALVEFTTGSTESAIRKRTE